ncbi:MAG: glyceraldehyde-3-phosphate dehydrogenase [Deltaproteobacteria bacterium]|nr:glyceraldehyde-3-phosphate dehydrogenase [Deltaproteobacteria bacterium]MBW1795826.1 glyceraldehyde-3-phosphate dehydrogenase [Deltaproteobacteria bacterium]
MKGGKLGINGLGRIGKLSIWQHVGRKSFSEIVVNIGRPVGTSLDDVARFIEKDSTYGTMHNYLYGYKSGRLIENMDEKSGSMVINGVPVTILREVRNPRDIPWKSYGVDVVVESTGQFTDPTQPADVPGGAIRGHLAAGARKVVVSAPFKIKDKGASMPKDAVMTVMGINDSDYDPATHHIISNASCTTNCLAYMIKPLLDYFGLDRILTASMATVHAVTGSQLVLDRSPKAGATDLRRNRSVFNNIILTTTGAAKALSLVIPEMQKIGFIAESVRIPVSTGSLIILVIDIQDPPDQDRTDRELINQIYRDAAERGKKGYLQYSDEQNVSTDMIGHPLAATVIEGMETHTRTATLSFDLKRLKGYSEEVGSCLGGSVIDISVTKVVVYGWYDNEMGGYVHMLTDRTVSIASTLE